jgi:hypothetical protein
MSAAREGLTERHLDFIDSRSLLAPQRGAFCFMESNPGSSTTAAPFEIKYVGEGH